MNENKNTKIYFLGFIVLIMGFGHTIVSISRGKLTEIFWITATVISVIILANILDALTRILAKLQENSKDPQN